MAGATLQSLKSRLHEDSKGHINLDVGTLPDTADVLAPVDDNAPEPYEILARLYAHLWHRIPLARSVARKFEGTGNSSGPFADLVSLFFALARRNERVIEAMGKEVLREFARQSEESRAKRKEKKEARKQKKQPDDNLGNYHTSKGGSVNA